MNYGGNMSRHTRRKAKRRAKVVTKRDHLNCKPNCKPNVNKLFWEMARIMTRQRPDPKLINKKSFCHVCKKYFCLGADSVEQYCDTCFYMKNKDAPLGEGMFFSGCTKEVQSSRPCRRCTK